MTPKFYNIRMDMSMNSRKLTAIALILSMALAGFAGCRAATEETVSETETTIETAAETETETETEPETETETETETEAETEPETEPPLPDEAERLDEADSNITGWSDEIDANLPDGDTTVEAEPEPEEPKRIYHYLNGKTVTEEEQKKRPVAIMVNNIYNCLPQAGISLGDMFYECSAEGGITRLMMLTTDYESIPLIGSIRSSRDYFIDFLANHEAIYIHAGGSSMAYEKISWRKINNLDGVNMYIPGMFWRDEWRLANMGLEHSLMTDGEKIAAGIEYLGYDTTLPDTYVCPFEFYDENTDNHISGSPATHVHMNSTSAQTVDFVYDQATGEYWRYQYNGMKHIDANNDQQLSVKNVIILVTDINVIPGDSYGRLSVGTVGEGQGYYITNGKRKVINWSRSGKTTPIQLEYRNGDELILNCGKTFICVVDDSVASKIDFEYSW